MSDLLLATKLMPPPRRSHAVERPRLLRKLAGIVEHRLTLVTAPAGFGKTTLLREWLARAAEPVGWLSLDASDDNPARFLRYLIEACRALDPAVGAEALALLDASRPLQAAAALTALTALINELTRLGASGVVLLDDYHVITHPAIHEAVGFLVAHLPDELHLVIAARQQPPITLARLRAQAGLMEVTAADLRFTAVEVDAFLSGVMAIDLPAADRAALDSRTEGWIAGLQLAALSLKSQPDPSAFIAAFAGIDRHIEDFLFEEVLQHQPEDVREFLLVTSVVDALCGDLCDALTESAGGQAMLDRLDAAQLFISPLDHQRQWYRYHPLFGDLLRREMARLHPDRLPTLHARASQWYAEQDRLEEAVRHGLLARDDDRAANLIEAAFQRQDWLRHDMERLLGWFDALPEAVRGVRPRLLLAHAWLLLEVFADPWSRIEAALARVEALVESGVPHLADAEAGLLRAQIDLLRANHARAESDPVRVLALCQSAVEYLPDDEMYIRSGAAAHRAAAYESLGELEQARDAYADAMRLCHAADNIDGLLFAAAQRIKLALSCGWLRDAESAYAQVKPLAARRTGPDMGMIVLLMGEVSREQNRLDEALSRLEEGIARCRPFDAWGDGIAAGWISKARTLAALDRFDEAMAALDEIEGDAALKPRLTPAFLECTRIRLLMMAGRYEDAARRAAHIGLIDAVESDSADVPPAFEGLTLVRLLLMGARLSAAGIPAERLTPDPLDAADRLLRRLDVAPDRRFALETCLVGALVDAARSRTANALRGLGEALAMAEPEGVVRLFLDEGEPLRDLLVHYLTRPTTSGALDAARDLLDAFPPRTHRAALTPTADPLTPGELRTLALLATDQSVEQIAAALSVSASTVRTYAKRIYSKLDAHSRAEAVYRARERKLL